MVYVEIHAKICSVATYCKMSIVKYIPRHKRKGEENNRATPHANENASGSQRGQHPHSSLLTKVLQLRCTTVASCSWSTLCRARSIGAASELSLLSIRRAAVAVGIRWIHGRGGRRSEGALLISCSIGLRLHLRRTERRGVLACVLRLGSRGGVCGWVVGVLHITVLILSNRQQSHLYSHKWLCCQS